MPTRATMSARPPEDRRSQKLGSQNSGKFSSKKSSPRSITDSVKPGAVVIPLSQDASQRSLFSLTKVVRLGRAQTAVSFTEEDLRSCRAVLEEARSGKYAVLGALRRLGCYRLCMEDVRGSGLGGIVRVLSLVHPKEEVRAAAVRLMGQWRRMVLREIFPLPRSKAERATTVGGGEEENVEASADTKFVGDGDGGLAGSGEEGAEQGDEEEVETYGYDVEAARNAPEGTETAPDELIRMEEEEEAYERMVEHRMRVEADPFCSSSSDEEGGSESDMWSPGMDRKRRARAQAMKKRKDAGVKRGTEVGGGERDHGGEVGGAEARHEEKRPRMSKAFMNLFAGAKKKMAGNDKAVGANETCN